LIEDRRKPRSKNNKQTKKQLLLLLVFNAVALDGQRKKQGHVEGV